MVNEVLIYMGYLRENEILNEDIINCFYLKNRRQFINYEELVYKKSLCEKICYLYENLPFVLKLNIPLNPSYISGIWKLTKNNEEEEIKIKIKLRGLKISNSFVVNVARSHYFKAAPHEIGPFVP
jgi:hypothetical protein